jgi:hypothetical protein
MEIDEKLLEILACPICKGELHLEEDGSGLICERCKLKYPIEDGIPVMLIDEAIRIGAETE